MLATRRTLLAVVSGIVASFAAAAPAAAQSSAMTQGGPSLLWVWVWILVVGVAAMIIGTSLGVSRR